MACKDVKHLLKEEDIATGELCEAVWQEVSKENVKVDANEWKPNLQAVLSTVLVKNISPSQCFASGIPRDLTIELQ